MEDVHEGTTSRWRVVPPAQNEEDVRSRHESSRAAWNEGASHYTAGNEERIAELRAGRSNLHPVERAMLSDLGSWCDTAIHLQCASGRDTLSLWLEGATRVVGVDISDVHIENARLTSEALAAPAEWCRCDILDTLIRSTERQTSSTRDAAPSTGFMTSTPGRGSAPVCSNRAASCLFSTLTR
jgi:hypothetical protein